MYINENKSREEHVLKRFKRKYNFVPDKPNGKIGTIDINGEKRRIDIDINSPVSRIIKGKKVPRRTMSDTFTGQGNIIIDKNFINLKNDKRRDAILQHEFAHTKFHTINGKSEVSDPRSFTNKNLGISRQSKFHRLQNLSGGRKFTKKERQVYNKLIDYNFDNIEDYKKKSANNPYAKKRDETLEIGRKYQSKTAGYHANPQEFEADVYAANKTSPSQVKRAMREMYKSAANKKTVKRDFKSQGESPLKSDVERVIKSLNRDAAKDMKARSRALKDLKLRKSEHLQ